MITETAPNILRYRNNKNLEAMGISVELRDQPQDLPAQGFRPNLKKRGAIRSVYDGRHKLNRYFAPLEHHMPRTMEQLFAHNDVDLFLNFT